MKARSLFYFLIVFFTLFFGCKKEGVTPTSIVGTWYVERYTVIKNDATSLSYYNEKQPVLNYESVGVFSFYQNGTGVYDYENQSVPFTFVITDDNGVNNNSTSFNGISIGNKSVTDNNIELNFDKTKISSVNSPILSAYFSDDEKRFKVFSRTFETLLFSSQSKRNEFLITKQ